MATPHIVDRKTETARGKRKCSEVTVIVEWHVEAMTELEPLGAKIGKKLKETGISLRELSNQCIQKTKKKLTRAPSVGTIVMSLRT